MRLRPTRPADFEKARDFLPVTARFAPRLREQLPGLWRELHARGQLNSLTIEHPRPTGEHEVVAVGISVFVSEAFADHALEHLEPFLNARLHELIVAGGLRCSNSHLEELRPSSPRRRGSPSLGDAAGTRLG